mmetsp:Transcript_10217/g.22778  ORF Transcript_10217/g.22778 Transcript_10217/m.22778 type:complete len:286 (-) Transcript_10217:12-869(-)
MEPPVHNRKEEGHAQKWLEPHDNQEERRPGYRVESRGDEQPVNEAPAQEQVELTLHQWVRAAQLPELGKGRHPDHVREDARHVQQEVPCRRAVEVPLVEGVAHAPVKPVVQVHVARREVIRHVPEQAADPVLKHIPCEAADPLAVDDRVVPLLVRERVRRPHHTPSKARPRAIVNEPKPQRDGAVRQLVAEDEREEAGDGEQREQGGGSEVGKLRRGVDVLLTEAAEGGRAVERQVGWDEQLLEPQVEELPHPGDGERPDKEKVHREHPAAAAVEAAAPRTRGGG